MPMDNVRAGIVEAVLELGYSAAHADRATEAIMTSDSRPKQIGVEFWLGGKRVRIGGICKGAGMIQPGMSPTGARPATLPHGGLHATMLGFITTDAAINAKVLQAALNEAIAHSFNRITVDGDMSTNDTVLCLANGVVGKVSLPKFQVALNYVCLELAKMIVKDGEGVTKFVTVEVCGAKSDRDAEFAARAVSNSALVKTSWCGGDPNWGRLMDAIGYSRCKIIEEKVDIAYDDVPAVKAGQPTRTPVAKLRKIVKSPTFTIRINLNLGRGRCTMHTCDLTEDYVTFNKGE